MALSLAHLPRPLSPGWTVDDYFRVCRRKVALEVGSILHNSEMRTYSCPQVMAPEDNLASKCRDQIGSFVRAWQRVDLLVTIE